MFKPSCRKQVSQFSGTIKGGSLKAEGFGDGKCRISRPQALLEAATQSLKTT
jgi:hypothetical protein